MISRFIIEISIASHWPSLTRYSLQTLSSSTVVTVILLYAVQDCFISVQWVGCSRCRLLTMSLDWTFIRAMIFLPPANESSRPSNTSIPANRAALVRSSQEILDTLLQTVKCALSPRHPTRRRRKAKACFDSSPANLRSSRLCCHQHAMAALLLVLLGTLR